MIGEGVRMSVSSKGLRKEPVREIDNIYFRCPSSSKLHKGLPDLVNDAPGPFYGVPEAERERRCVLHSDFCIIDDAQYYIRCVLEIPIQGEAHDRLGWGIWCQVDARDFEAYGETFAQDRQSHLGPFYGVLANTLTGYPETMGLPCRIILKDGGLRPLIELEPGNHPLIAHQRQGITLKQAISFASRVMVADDRLGYAH